MNDLMQAVRAATLMSAFLLCLLLLVIIYQLVGLPAIVLAPWPLVACIALNAWIWGAKE
jgi:hypothetical protein